MKTKMLPQDYVGSFSRQYLTKSSGSFRKFQNEILPCIIITIHGHGSHRLSAHTIGPNDYSSIRFRSDGWHASTSKFQFTHSKIQYVAPQRPH